MLPLPRCTVFRALGASIVASVVVSLAAAGCASAPAGTAQVSALPSPVVDPEVVLANAAARMSSISYTKFALVHEVGSASLASLGLLLTSVEGEVAMPDRFSLRMEATPIGQTAFVKIEIIFVDGRAYMRLLGRWGEIDPDTLPFDFSDLGQTLSGIINAMQAPSVVGTEQIGGVELVRVRAAVDSGDFLGLVTGASAGFPVELEVWIGRDDSLLYLARVAGQLFPDDQADVVRLLTLRDIDVPVDIEAPAT